MVSVDVAGRRVLAAAFVVAGVLGLGCDSGPEDATLEFDTAVEVDDAVLRARAWCFRNAFAVTSGPREVNAEKRRPLASGGGHQVDVLFVRFKREPDFTHVTIRALTDLDDEHGRRRAAQVSNEARADVQALARELTAPTPGG
jgi:hypothetical protein